MKSLALASKPQVLENCPVLGSRTALLFCTVEILWENARNFAEKLLRLFFVFLNWRSLEKNFKDFFFGDRLKNIFKTLFFLFEKSSARVLSPWPRVFLSLALRGSVFGKAVLNLEPCVLEFTSAK